MLTNLKINARRLWDSLMDTAAFGGTEKGGLKRLTLTDEDKLVRDWFKTQCEALGCKVSIDEVGNMFATRSGRDDSLPPIAMGSHLDTQPTGGKFDGILGVLAALEVMRTLHEQDYETNAPIEIVNWTNEEGSRFPPAMLASGVFASVFPTAYAYEQVDRNGVTFLEELERIGYRGSMKAGDHKLSAMFELHIEQGPILEAEKKMIGIVTGVQGMRWYEVNVHGQDAHTGATPMYLRKNALLGAARIIEAIDAIGQKHQPGVATVGLIENKPNSRNVVPGEVFLTVDMRHPDEIALDAMEADFRAALETAIPALGLTYEEKKIWSSPAVKFAPELIDCVRSAAAKSNFGMRDMVSGAGHDAAYIARVAPTTMIFVPCEGGISHNEAEATSPEECAAGAQVLLDAVLAYDQTLAK
ncbi:MULTISPECIES: M20 family metallo-hydrolase [unclassified Hyphomicrobium]|uniref:M20 family metallo-hydrolase n=1 Tax=unclassified Hyphomicrobium TaxID=2619925 RepID=UPI000213D411|nr:MULTISPECIES: M20 family metallo-hydrolase [unclassified Hyphomicrobium]CCB68065.1 N-carbamyl-L-amino acid hydrolase (amidase, hydantoinase/carbamoylase family) [Hyphomicrobium sp. MC1]